MKVLTIILIVILCGMTIFSAFKYITIQKEKKILLGSLKQVEQQVVSLEKDKQILQNTIQKEKEVQRQLSEENNGLKENLKENEERLAKYSNDFSQAQKAIEDLNSQLFFLKDERDRLMIQFAEVTQEKDILKAKVSSVKELKKAIRELKIQMRSVTYEIIKKKPKSYHEITDGNRGFMFKNGMPTYTSKIRIKVEPALKE
jgi:chromosome segregation ATPase